MSQIAKAEEPQPVKRMNVNIPLELHNNFKSITAAQGLNMQVSPKPQQLRARELPAHHFLAGRAQIHKVKSRLPQIDGNHCRVATTSRRISMAPPG